MPRDIKPFVLHSDGQTKQECMLPQEKARMLFSCLVSVQVNKEQATNCLISDRASVPEYAWIESAQTETNLCQKKPSLGLSWKRNLLFVKVLC